MSRMIDEQVLVKIAKENANAIHGLNPKITVWSGDGNDAMAPIKNLAKNLIPALDIVRDQTGYSFPEWLVKKEQPKDGVHAEQKVIEHTVHEAV
jgi:flotillin